MNNLRSCLAFALIFVWTSTLVRAQWPTGAAQIKQANPSAVSGLYWADPDGASGPSGPIITYMDMSTLGGGWNLLASINGASSVWGYNSALWTDSASLNPDTYGTSGAEFKSAAFSLMPFSAVMIAIQDGSTMRYLSLDLSGSSLEALFEGPTRSTSLPASSWTGLVTGSSLQPFITGQGVNIYPSPSPRAAGVRLGIVANNEPDVFSPDSFLGLGGTYNGIPYGAGYFNNGVFTPVTARIYVRDDPSAVPEPSTGVLFGLASVTCHALSRRRSRVA